MSYRTSRSFQRNDWPLIAVALLEERSRLVLRIIQLEQKNEQPKEIPRIHYCISMRLAEGEFSGGKQVRCKAYKIRNEVFNNCGEPCRWIMEKSGEGEPPWP